MLFIAFLEIKLNFEHFERVEPHSLSIYVKLDSERREYWNAWKVLFLNENPPAVNVLNKTNFYFKALVTFDLNLYIVLVLGKKNAGPSSAYDSKSCVCISLNCRKYLHSLFWLLYTREKILTARYPIISIHENQYIYKMF